MASTGNNYFSLEGVLDYQKLLKHFKNQASGKSDPKFIHPNPRSTSEKRMSQSKNSLVLLDIGGNESDPSKSMGQAPKIEVVDPLKAESNRAIDQLQVETRQEMGKNPFPPGGPATKSNVSKVKAHSTSAGKKKKSNFSSGSKSKRKIKSNQTSVKVKAKIRRARDVFD